MCVLDCNDVTPDSTEIYSPSDRRFWLLTIIAGFFGPNDFPLLEDKLAKLYRIAFMRQQARHLGIENRTNDDIQTVPFNFNNFPYIRKRKRRGAENTTEYYNTTVRKRRKLLSKRNANLTTELLSNSTKDKLKLYDRIDGVVAGGNVNSTDDDGITKVKTNMNEKLVQKNRDPNKVDIIIHNATYLTVDELRKLAEDEVESNFLR